MIDARAVIAGFIAGKEGGLSLHPSDNGNWYSPARFAAGQPQLRGQGDLVGSKFGVTAYALIGWRHFQGRPDGKAALLVTRADITAITIDLAVSIGVALYYLQPGLNRLAWNRVTASVLDKAWGSGPDVAIRMLQRLIGAEPDGQIGPISCSRFATWLNLHGEEHAAYLWCDARVAFDQQLATNDGPGDPDAAFVSGWNNRSRSFLPGTPWWARAAA